MQRQVSFLVMALAAALLVQAGTVAAVDHHPVLGAAQANRGKAGYVAAPPPAEPIAVPRMDLPANYVGEGVPVTPAPAAPAGPPPPQPNPPTLGTNFEGIPMTSFFPPDPILAAGPSALLLIVNGGIRLSTKTGTTIASDTLTNFYNGSLAGSHAFDPKCLYDPHSGRFFTAALDGTASPNSWLRIAVSKTSNPGNLNVGATGGDDWWGFDIDADKDGGSQVNNNWADFPGLGVDQYNVYVTANMFSNAGTFQYAKVWVILKAGLVSGGPITVFEFGAPPMTALTNPTTGFMDDSIRPAIDFDLTNEHMLATNSLSGSNGNITFWTVNNPATTPTLSATNLLVATWNSFTVPDCGQLGGGTGLDSGDTNVLQVIERNGSIWATHTQPSADALRAEARWYQINPTPAVVQYGQVADPSRCYFYPAIHPDAGGNVCLVMSGVDATIHGSAFFTGRAAVDAAGTMQAVASLKDGLTSYVRLDSSGRNRWGDYGGMAADPATGEIWMMHEFASATVNRWSTWVGTCSLGTCGNGVVEPGEGCDDNNTTSGDGCSATCQVESCHTCTGQPSTCSPVINGTPCNDGLFCNGTDTCSGGNCTHSGNPCPGPDGDGNCAESCDEATDSCTAPDPDGSACNDGDTCTSTDVCTAGVCAGTPTCMNHFLCYKVKTTSGFTFTPVIGASLTDQFDTGFVFDATKPKRLCTPADKNGGGIPDPATHVKGYQVKAEATTPKHVPQADLTVRNQFGDIHLNTIKPDFLLVPTTKNLSTDPPLPGANQVDNYKCYKVKVTPGTAKFPKGTTATVADQFTSPAKSLAVLKPTHLCTPVSVNGSVIKHPLVHQLCYKAKPATGAPKHTPQLGLHVNNTFSGLERLDTKKEELLCVPSLKFLPGP